MKYLFLSLFLFVNLAFGFDSVKVSDKGITLNKYGYFTTKQKLSPLEALKYTNSHTLLQLPKQAKNFGFDNHTYWFAFDVSTTGEEDYVIAIKNPVASSCELFVFDNGKMLRHDISGYHVPIEKRAIHSLPLRFKLEENRSHITYLVKIDSKNPYYTAFEFGKKETVDKGYYILVFITIAAFSISIIMIFYNLALYFAIRDTTYLYYCFYIGSYFMFDISALGFLPILSPFFTSIALSIPIVIFLQATHIGLTLFTIKFLGLDKNNPKLKKQLLYILYFMLFSALLIPIHNGIEFVAIFSIAVLMFFLLYSAAKTYIKGYKPALFYLIATGVAIIFNMLFMNMSQNGGVPYNLWTFNFMSFGLIWDTFFLSFAIAYRIRLLQEENLKNERLAMMKFRETTIGELSGNIAHQWRQPLAELGSINANVEASLKYGKIQKEELLEQISLSTTILRHLSETVNTFSKFFQNQKINEKFSVQSEIQRCINFVADSMQDNNIEIIFNEKTDVFLTGHANEFAQVILNILLNAKDVLIMREVQNRYIKIEMRQDGDDFTILISDNGGGIKIKPIKSIFESYVTDKQNGTGIGLFLAKTILMQKFNAKIEAYNNKNQGIFKIIFQSTAE